MKYIRDTTGDPDSQKPPRSQSIKEFVFCICSKNVILTSFGVLVLTYSVLRIRLLASSKLAKMTFLGQETIRKQHKDIPVYMRYVHF